MKKIIILLVLNFYSIKCSTQNDYQSMFKRGLLKLKEQSNYDENFDKNNIRSKINENIENYELVKNSLNDFINNFDISSQLPPVSPDCSVQLLKFIPALQQKQSWTFSIIDSFGKPPSGILNGDTQWLGEFSQCRKSINESINWHSNYCKLGKPSLNPLQPSIIIGICVPELCNKKDIAELINFGIDNIPENITNILPFNITEIDESYVQCYESAKIDTSAIVAILVISVLVFFALFGTFYDMSVQSQESRKIKPKDAGFKNKIEEDSKENNENRKSSIINSTEKEIIEFKTPVKEPLFIQIALCFSVYTNLKKLFTINKNADQLDCLHAIRFLSMAWVCLGHTFAFSPTVTSNPLVTVYWLQRFSFMIISNAFFSVDSFFLISGLLTSYIFMKEIAKRNNKITFDMMFKFYIHRLWRITPPYMLTIMFTACLTQYLGTGPNYPTKDGLDPFCKENWWTNLLYVNNLVNPEKMCFGISWYLANDMQFHWISPILLIPFALGKKYIGLGLSLVFLFVNILSTALIHNAYPGSELGNFGPNQPEFFNKIYITPWCRIGPFVIGILAGYYIHICKNNPNFKLKNVVNICGWILSLFALGLMLFGIFPDYNINPEKHLNRAENILYQSTSRVIWAIALAFIIFSCVMKKGGFMNDIFCWAVWTPLSRLSFSAYLIHLDVIMWYLLSQQRLIFGHEINLAYIFIGNMVLAYCSSLVVSLLFEIPLLGLEKFIFKRK